MAGRHFTQPTATALRNHPRAAGHMGAARAGTSGVRKVRRGERDDGGASGIELALDARGSAGRPIRTSTAKTTDECRTRALLGSRESASGPGFSSPPRCPVAGRAGVTLGLTSLQCEPHGRRIDPPGARGRAAGRAGVPRWSDRDVFAGMSAVERRVPQFPGAAAQGCERSNVLDQAESTVDCWARRGC